MFLGCHDQLCLAEICFWENPLRLRGPKPVGPELVPAAAEADDENEADEAETGWALMATKLSWTSRVSV